MASVKVCLNAIVKDEEHIIVRCLDNVRHLIDRAVIADTGSSDNTIQIMETYFKENGIPYTIVQHKWENFGHNRTLAIRAAEKSINESECVKLPDRPVTFKEWNSIGGANKWYLLFMDADNLLYSDNEKKFTFNRQALEADIYRIDMKQAVIRYDYAWLIKIDPKGERKWKWNGVLHEYVCPDGTWTPTSGKLLGGYILSGREGSRSKDPNKYLRDAHVFEIELKKDPNNARNQFYYAQSLRDAGKHEDALKAYLKRGDMGDWVEERYVSYVEAGKLQLMINSKKPYKAIELWNRAIEIRDSRLEAPYWIVHTYRALKMFKTAFRFGSGFMGTQTPKDGALFLDYVIHNWRFNDEVAICAYYAGRKDVGKRLNEKILDRSDLSDNDRNRIKENLKFCN